MPRDAPSANLHAEAGTAVPGAKRAAARKHVEGELMGVFYAQIRFRESREWLTVAKAESRKSALEYATAAFRQSRDDAGRAPIEVRVLVPQSLAQAGTPS
jgi:hypothetical protein